MSSNGAADFAAYSAETASNALDVGFSSIASQHGESSSQAESRSSGKKSARSWRKERGSDELDEQPVTPDDAGRQRQTAEEGSGSMGSLRHRARKSGGFLLDSVFANGSPKGGQNESHGKRKAQDGHLRVDKRRQPTARSRFSGESSQKSSPLAREVALDGHDDEDEDMEIEQARQSSRPQSMDPAQLVQMALSLSENRKRHVSNSLQVPLPPSGRVTSMPLSNYGTVRTTSTSRKRSGQMSDSPSKDSPRSNRSGLDEDYQYESALSNSGADNVLYTFSPATLSRAEKARKYFELANEHRRLLQHLPPLKPDASAPNNYTFETRNQPGSPFPDIQRVSSGTENKHALGRRYNPIQALRNRRVRIREKRPFPAPPDSWADPENVKKWIDDVEVATENPAYRAAVDQTQLPRYDGDDETDSTLAQNAKLGHRKTDTVGSVITRPENSWTIEPTELLADVYWTENRDNKAHIENRHGNPVFPQAVRRSIDTPKISIELHRGMDELASAGIETEDFEESGRPSRRRRLMMPLLTQPDSHRRKHRRLISRSPSESSESDIEGRIGHGASGYENIGPLERHMQELIAKDESGELSSPDMASPDHWDTKPLPHPQSSMEQSHREPLSQTNGRPSLEVPRDLHKRSRSADGRVNSLAQPGPTSTEKRGSEPTSPDPQKTASTGQLEITPTDGRRSLDAQRPQGPPQAPRLPSFRSRSKDRNNVDQVDFAAATGSALSPILSGDTWRPRSSQDAERPSDFRRHKTNDSMNSSLHRLETNSTTGTFSSIREPGSTVGRLFKGGRDRIGTLVRGERSRKRDRLDTGTAADSYRGASDVSDMEDVDGPNGYLRKRIGTDSPGDDSDVSPRASLDRTRSKQKYQLPAFTSSARDRKVVPGTPITADTNPFERFKSSQNDTGKSQKLVPPRLNIPEEDSTSHTVRMPTAIRFDTTRKSYGDLRLDAPLPSANTSISRSPGQRHWSIYDQAQPIQQSGRITARDIAGVRALLLCSGIKAREIQRRANTPRDPVPPELLKVAEITGEPVPTVVLKEEHLVAARMLSTHLTSSFSTLETALSHFQSETARHLAASLDELHHRASDQLTSHVHDASDEADAFIVELTTRQPQQTKRVDEAVDLMLRRRRRQFWFLRQAGFKLLEWLVVCLLWGIWFLVVVFNTVRKGIVVVGRFVRWLVVP